MKDKKYKRRSSLPSYVCLGDYERRDSSKAEENTSSVKQLKSLTDIMNQVVKETDQTRLQPCTPPNPQSSVPVSPVEPVVEIKPLVCSPYVSPEKLYPKFVFTPKITAKMYEEKAQCMSPPAVVFSLDTTKETFSTSSTSPVSELGEHSAEEIVSEITPQNRSEESVLETLTTLNNTATYENTPKKEDAFNIIENEEKSNSGSVYSTAQNNGTESVSPGVTKSVHTAVMRPTPSKKIAHHLRASSPVENEQDEGARHTFVRRVHTPCFSPVNTSNEATETELLTPKTLNKSSDSQLLVTCEDGLQLDETTRCESSTKPENLSGSNEMHSHNTCTKSESGGAPLYTSEMNLMDSFSSFISSTFGEESSLTNSLVSPSRTKNLVDEASTHARRRRPSAQKTLSSKAMSESGLSFHLAQNPQVVRRQTSSPLISPARHEMLVRRASECILAKRRSTLSTEDGQQDSELWNLPVPLNLSNVDEDPRDRSSECNIESDVDNEAELESQNKGTLFDGQHNAAAVATNHEPNRSLHRNNSERSQRRYFPFIFQWRSFRGRQRNPNKVTDK